MVREHVGPLFRAALKGQGRFVEPLFELLLQPLALHVLLVLLALIHASTRWYAIAALAVVAVHVVLACVRQDRPLENLKALALAPIYIFWKLTKLGAVLKAGRKDADWVRTDREDADERGGGVPNAPGDAAEKSA